MIVKTAEKLEAERQAYVASQQERACTQNGLNYAKTASSISFSDVRRGMILNPAAAK